VRLIPVIRPATTLADLIRAGFVGPGGDLFAGELGAALGRSQVSLFSSGRAALAVLLQSARTAVRDEVALPAYTCWSVPAAAVRAGLRVRLFDVDPLTGCADPDSLTRADLGRSAALVIAHLLSGTTGIDGVVRELRARYEELLVVEDAAQSWRLELESAHAAILSFGRGKPLALGSGGAILSRDPHAAPRAGEREAIAWGRTSLALSIALSSPWLFRLPASLPWLRLGETVYEPAFRVGRGMRAWKLSLGRRALARMGDVERLRSDNAARLAAELGGLPGWRIPRFALAHGPLRFALLAPDRACRDRFVDSLRRGGVVASAMYPGTLADVPGLRAHIANAGVPMPGARELADRLVTLPCYPSLGERDLLKIAAVARGAALNSG
jgi:dTDP-4-amino-4,6-dideoxygalactose transaminase